MVRCCVSGCPNYEGKKDSGVRFFRFPKDLATEKKWINACGKVSRLNIRAARMCSDHFTNDDWKLEHILLDIPEKKKRLREGAVPTRNLPEECVKCSERDKRYQRKQRKQLVEEILSSYDKSQEEEEIPELEEVVKEEVQNNEIAQNSKATCSNVEIQTEFNLECSRELEMYTLRGENVILKYQIKKLLKRLGEVEATNKSINKIFTKGQIKRLKNPEQKFNWNKEDFSSAISIYTAGPRAYKLLCNRNYPLPSEEALKEWISKSDISPGILGNIINLLSNCNYSQHDRLCVLSLDKIEVKSCFDNVGINNIAQKSKFVHIAMVRGLIHKWKHVIYYSFDYATSSSTLIRIVKELKKINFKVIAVVTDIGQDRLMLWKDLKITEEKPYFKVDSDKIFFFVDVPYIIKLIRHHFLGSGFILNGKIININPIKELISLDKTDLTLYHKLTEAHINIKKSSRQKVKFATQIFSNSVSEDLKKCILLGKINSENAFECCDFIRLVNDWFDVFNSKSQSPDNSYKTAAYGLALEHQNTIIHSMFNNIKNLRVVGMETMRPFQRGILLNNSSLPKLFKYLQDEYNVTNIITNRLNQDELKKFLEVMNAKGSLQDHPTPLEFKNRFRSAILSHLTN